ncbi:helix-turn-helix domain-containing protein [Galactobacter valiniphilus]|uniref:Helix-turn-helix domain-containing protein n=1 Tax=Galactobacter valiniphilus TaxID=2676122 RepID=A0A399J675_9MICC|nr:helix-turn-helix domain-containing protein [Galactobacter valiniphilus]RII40911.1 helix-turn-helix domain-containing protein [Galactobacter valiniphilus]
MFIGSTRDFAAFVRSHRIGAKMTQDELARATGMSRRWVQEIEAERIKPTLEAVLSVAATFKQEMHLEPAGNADPFREIFEGL